MSNSPLISICIPVYNGENFILECIGSVLSQSYQNIELVIIDNNSNDNTVELINTIEDKRVSLIRNKENIGSINNFNKCIFEAKGEFFILLPHDDLLLPGCLDVYLKCFENPDVGFAYSSIQIIDQYGEMTSSKINHQEDKLFDENDTINDIANNFVPIQLAMVRTKVIRNTHGFDISYGPFCDIQLWLRVVLENWSSYYVHKPISCHRIHPNQGQTAFLFSDLKTISEHWGKKVDKKFLIENSYNRLMLKFSGFFFTECLKNGLNINNSKDVFLQVFIKSHIRGLFNAAITLNFFSFKYELVLFKEMVSQYGFRFNLVILYSRILLTESLKKVQA